MNRHLTFKASEAAKIMDWEPEAVARVGQYIDPDVPANGKGYRALYSFRNLVEMRLSDYLARFGVPQKRIQKYVIDLRKSQLGWLEENGPDDGYLVLDNLWRWAAGSTVEEIIANLSLKISPVGMIVVNIGAIKRALKMSLENSTVEGEVIHEQ